ncbi:MAG: PqqD family peptide modification chaperone [Proteobacteria bacterium]|nr:PqqD family peptide modification chaperone [Pseudomonadota bacterium]
MINLNSMIKREEHSVSALMDEGLAIINIENNAYYFLNSVSRRIWELLDTPLSVKGLCDRLMDEFSTSQHQCQADVLDFLTRFHREGMIDILAD